MSAHKDAAGQALLVRLPKDADLLEAVEEVCQKNAIQKATLQLIGALQSARLGYYPQDVKQYVCKELNEGVEILGTGNVSLKDGKPMVHLHLTLIRKDFSCVGGHAMPGCILFAGELAVLPLAGPALNRVYDEATGLFLWA